MNIVRILHWHDHLQSDINESGSRSFATFLVIYLFAGITVQLGCIENIHATSRKLTRSFCVAAIFPFSSDSDASITLTAFIRRKATARCPSVRLSVWLFRGCSNVNAVIQRRPHTASVGLRFNRLLRAPIQPAGSTAVETRLFAETESCPFSPGNGVSRSTGANARRQNDDVIAAGSRYRTAHVRRPSTSGVKPVALKALARSLVRLALSAHKQLSS